MRKKEATQVKSVHIFREQGLPKIHEYYDQS